MPLDQEAWEQAYPVRTIRDQIIDFLQENPEKAYSFEEIAAELTGELTDNGASVVISMFFFSIVDGLLDTDRIEARKIETSDENKRLVYYRAKTDNEEQSK